MARAKAVTVGGGRASVRVEYFKTRGMLRLSTVSEDGPAPRRLEVPVDALAHCLGTDLLSPGMPKPFLLFGGSSSEPRPGSSCLLAAFPSEGEARIAFHRLRESLIGRPGWAELVVLDGRSGPRRLCWFERVSGQAGGCANVSVARSVTPPRGRTWSARLRRRGQSYAPPTAVSIRS